MAAGSAAQGGIPDTLLLKPARRPSQVIRPARWAIATQITSAVSAVAAPVPQITSLIGAPLAGSVPAASAGDAAARLAGRMIVAAMAARVASVLICSPACVRSG